MRPELFTVKPSQDGPYDPKTGFGPDGQIRIEIRTAPMLEMICNANGCDWSFRYGSIGLPDLLAHAENHSAEHPDTPEEPWISDGS